MAEKTTKSDKKGNNQFSKIDYSKVDPIIKENPKISLEEFKTKCSEKLSAWTFYNRKKLINTGKQFGQRKSTIPINSKASIANIPVNSKASITHITVANIMKQCAPANPTDRKDYENVAGLLLENINATHSEFKKKGLVKMCDANFYTFRKKVKTLLEDEKTKKILTAPIVPIPKKRKTMYTLIYEKDLSVKGINDESREFINEFLGELNKRKNLDLEIVELIAPRHVLEVRSY